MPKIKSSSFKLDGALKVFGNIVEGDLWTPSNLNDAPSVWYDFADPTVVQVSGAEDNCIVQAVRDKSDNFKHLFDSNTDLDSNAFQPRRQLDALNGKSTLKFDGVNDRLESEAWMDGSPTEFYIALIARVDNTSGTSYIFHYGEDSSSTNIFLRNNGGGTCQLIMQDNTGNYEFLSANIPEGGYYFIEIKCDSVANDHYYKIHDLGEVTSSYNLSGHFGGATKSFIGCKHDVGAYSEFLEGEVGEFLMMDRVPSDEERAYIQGYLCHKWGLQHVLEDDHPFKKDIPTIVLPDFKAQTSFDGVDDFISSSDTSLKISGAQTFALEVFIKEDPASNYEGIISNYSGPGMGIQNNTNGNIAFYATGGLVGEVDVTSYINQWIKVMLYFDGTNAVSYINGVQQHSMVSSLTQATSSLYIGQMGPQYAGRFFEGIIRNIEIYSGFPSNPSNWIPGDTSSLTGTTLVMQSRDGSGTDNDQGITFSKTGTYTIELYEGKHLYSHTMYDGINDYSYSSDSSLKIAGKQTWCCEIKRVDVSTNSDTFIANDNSGTGIVVRVDSSGVIRAFAYGSTTPDIYGTTNIPISEWVKVIFVVDETEARLYVNGVHEGSDTLSTFSTSTGDFFIGSDNNSNHFLGKIRNVEIYSGATTNPENWKPGFTNTLNGTTLVMQSRNGSGDDNVQGIAFTKNSNPYTQYFQDGYTIRRRTVSKGYVSAGYTTVIIDDVQAFDFSSMLNISNVGNLTTNIRTHSGISSQTQGFCVGGYTTVYQDFMNKFDFSSVINAREHGNIGTTRGYVTSASYTTKGFFASGGNGTWVNEIRSFDYSSNTTSSDLANLSVSNYAAAGCYSDTQAFVCGGRTTVYISNIYKYDFVSTTNSVSHGNLTYSANGLMGNQNKTHGVVSGGSNPSRVNTINKFEFVSNTTASDHGDLFVAISSPATNSSEEHGFVAGGSPSAGGSTSQIQKIEFVSNTTATDHGDLLYGLYTADGHQG